MAQNPDGKHRTSSASAGSSPGEPTVASSPPPPPPRPGTSFVTPPPIIIAAPMPQSVRWSRSLWLLSFVAGIVVLAGTVLTANSHLERLRAVVEEMAPGGDAEAVTTSTAIVFWGSLGAMALVILLEAAALALVMARKGWARWLLIILLACHVLAAGATAVFLVPDGDGGSYVVLLWGAQLLLALSGLILLFTPSAGTWLKSDRIKPAQTLSTGKHGSA